MKTIVLDDDPTGTQSATGVRVLLDSDADLLTEALGEADSVYVQTNTRALYEADAVKLVSRIRSDGECAGARLGEQVRFVLRGDSTLRGHVFAETEVFLNGKAVMVFVPAFPDGGRTTCGGVHFVRVGDRDLPAHQSEYADDPVFGFSTGVLVDYVAEKSGRTAVQVPLDIVRSGELADVLTAAEPGSVVVPDAVDNGDIGQIAATIEDATRSGADVVVRCAAPLAAELAGKASRGLLASPLVPHTRATLLVCGSHTAGATAQVSAVIDDWGLPAVVDTERALDEPESAGAVAAKSALAQLDTRPLAVVVTERERLADHGTLDHGERIMTALTAAVQAVLPEVSVVVAKGGITSAEVARNGIGATSALVLGQILPGISVWQMHARDHRAILYIVVPGNVGGPTTLTRVLDALRVTPRASSPLRETCEMS